MRPNGRETVVVAERAFEVPKQRESRGRALDHGDRHGAVEPNHGVAG
jgi:hypothetical protein